MEAVASSELAASAPVQRNVEKQKIMGRQLPKERIKAETNFAKESLEPM